MTTLLDIVGPAILRASWQATVLALVIALLVRLLGERISPRWRYLLWSVVVIRLLLVVTPASPWSAFNLVPASLQASAPDAATASDSDTPRASSPLEAEIPPSSTAFLEAEPPAPAASGLTLSSSIPVAIAREASPSVDSLPRFPSVIRILTSVWLAGLLVLALHLAGAALILRRRLSACRRVTDAAVLAMLDAACQRIGLRSHPRLLVTPESMSPCIVGTWRPWIILPESIVAECSSPALRHVLAHELAHLARGDLWTNWLLLLARTVHWFNPVAWWTVSQMQAEREAACDELALATLGETDRSAYGATIIELATNLAPSGMAPAMIGLMSSTRRLKSRIERLARSPSVATLRAPVAVSIVLMMALVGLTDTMPAALAEPSPVKSAPAAERKQEREAKAAETITIRGRCLDDVGKWALPGSHVRLFKAEGRTSPIVEVATTIGDPEGRFEFANLIPPRPEDPIDPLLYVIVAESIDRPIGVAVTWPKPGSDPEYFEIRILREMTTLTGTVRDARGKPVAGATVAQWSFDGRPVPGALSAVSGADGRFKIDRIPHYAWLQPGAKNPPGLGFHVSHPQYPQEHLNVLTLPGDVAVTLTDGCRVRGAVTDGVTGKPGGGILVLAERLGKHSITSAATDAAGRFEMVLPEDRFTFVVKAKDRVAIAISDRDCLAGETVELPPFKLTSGGFISGRVVNASTGQPIVATDDGRPIFLGLLGPAQPLGKVVSPSRMATVDSAGRYTLRAAPGENFPYFVNLRGERMGWNTTRQPPVVVKEGETTSYDMLVRPPVPPEEKLQAAQKRVDSLPKQPAERTEQILAEFRKLSHTADEEELWCMLMRELVGIGRGAVPLICEELDRTTQDRALRRLAFALRAIGDPRATPALIRAFPKTLLPSSSDYGLLVADAELTEFMQKHDSDEGRRGKYFGFNRPCREVAGALHKLTAQNFDDAELFGISLSGDPRRQALQRRLYLKQAQRWQTWWEANWRQFTDDAAYQTVKLGVADMPLPPASTALGANAKIENRLRGATLSPPIQEGKHARFFHDLDTGSHPKWPTSIPKVEAEIDEKQLADWAATNGVDLMCVTHRAADGKQTYVLRSFGMKVWEISQRDLRNLDKLVAADKLPEGHDVGDLLMSYDGEAKRSVPDANAAFLYITREGCMGLIETTDRVVRTADLTGSFGGPTPGVGFFLGVRYNLKDIIP